jgi:predicted amidohydrolase YtcJ
VLQAGREDNPGLPEVRKMNADLILRNANIHTVNERKPRAEAVAIQHDRILCVGTDDEVMVCKGNSTQVVDLERQTVLPGLTDAHCHLQVIGERELTLNLEGVRSLQGFLDAVGERTKQVGQDEWVTGRGWIETFWSPPDFPTRWDLDRVASQNPVFLVRADGHGAVANSVAMKIAGIGRATPDPVGGEILRDETGAPNGMLIDAAQGFVRKKLPKVSRERAKRELEVGGQRSLELGWCQVHDMGGRYDELDLFEELYGSHKLKVRVYKSMSGPGEDAQRLIREGAFGIDNRFTVRAIKLFTDGAVGSRGAALLAPYSDAETSGFLIHEAEELRPVLVSALGAGIQIQTHAIGDLANRFTLDLYQEAFEAVPASVRKISDPRWRVEHAQIVSSEDVPRFHQLGVIPSMQPSHAISDLHFSHIRLGIRRMNDAYAWRSFLDSGSAIAGGSDAPVERGEPMVEFYAAVERRDLEGYSGEGWHPELAVSRMEALKMFTTWAAFSAFEEDTRGSIEVGKLADFTVLSQDIMSIPASEIPETVCSMTVIGGEVVFDRDSLCVS